MISDENEIANYVINKYFVNVASQLKEPVEHSDFKHITGYVDSKVPSNTFFSIPEITISVVRNFLVNLDVTKAIGLECIGPKLRKIAPDVLSPGINYLDNKSGIFPQPWKEAKVSPVFKSGCRDDINNDRPISILPALSKFIEKWINKQLITFF